MARPASILLVEDSRMDAELLLDAFREAKLGNKIEVTETGEAALEYLQGVGAFADRTKYPLPDLILLDIKLPGVDGLEVLRTIKSTDVIKRIPVVMLTSSREEGDRLTSYDNGANSYLVKPVKFDEFIDVANEIANYWLMLNVGPL